MSRVFAGVLLSALLLPFGAVAQDETDGPPEPGPWSYGVVGGLNIAQSAFSDNWAGGDKGTINWVANADLSAERQVTPEFHWSNKLELAYGQTATQVSVTDTLPSGAVMIKRDKEWSRPDKTTDRIFFESLGRFTLDLWVDPYVSAQLEAQFVDESDPIGSLLFNPLKITESAGIARVFRKTEEEELTSRVGFGFRQSIGRTFTDATGDETESFTTSDGGFEFRTDAKKPLHEKRILYQGRLKVFYPVFFSQSSDLEDFDALAIAADPFREEVADYWKSPDVDFLNTFSAEITSWMSVILLVQWVYDKYDAATNVDLANWDPSDPATHAPVISEIEGGIRKSGQFKQTLAIGLTYRFL
jgi:hypothetical protein